MSQGRERRGGSAPGHELSRPGGFLAAPQPSAEVRRVYDADLDGLGYVMNNTRLWAHLPAALDGLAALLGRTVATAGLSLRQRGVLVTACASAAGDSYCTLAWGSKLAREAGDAAAAGVAQGDDGGLEPREQALARWARRVVRDPTRTSAADVEELREAGFDDAQIFAITAFVGLRLAFSTVNAALGAEPDAELAASAPSALMDAVTFGRPPASVT